MNENIEKNMEIIDSYNDGLNEGWHRGIQEGIERGIEQGIEQGIQENKKEILLNMYNKNLTISEISELTGLNVEDIRKIIDSNQK